jgi:hypothetical membrane protein
VDWDDRRETGLDHRRGLIGTSVVIGATMALVAQLSAPPSYIWVNRTLSELAAAGYERAWIMRLGMTSFGVLLLCGLLLDLADGGRRAQPTGGARSTGALALLMVYAIAVVLCAVWPVGPLDMVTRTEAAQGGKHNLAAMAMIAGLAGSIMCSYAAETDPVPKRAHLAALVLVASLAAVFVLTSSGVLPGGQGLAQRAGQVLGSAWILYAHTAAGPRDTRPYRPAF